MIKVQLSPLGDAQVFTVSGRLDAESAPEFDKQIQKELAGDCTTSVVDLTGLEYLSSAGIRTILSAGKALQAKDGGKMILCVPKGQTRQVIEAVGLHKMFNVCDNLEEAGKHISGNFKVFMHKEWEADVMTVFGRVDAERAPEMEQVGRKVLDTPYQKLLINMSAVQYLSSAGLCALLNLGKAATAKHGRLFVCSPSASVKQILKLSGFDKILTIRNSVQDALVE